MYDQNDKYGAVMPSFCHIKIGEKFRIEYNTIGGNTTFGAEARDVGPLTENS